MILQTNVAAAAETAATPSGEIEEVVVTANKRSQDIQDVGASVQTATGSELGKLGITDTASLQKIAPGLSSTLNASGITLFSIRGVGFQDPSLAGSPTVSLYLDEAPVPFSILAQGMTLDLQRVEVLKGPQGTLFGNNATGGAINYIAAKPTDDDEAGLDLSYGSYSDTIIQGFASGPIAQGLDARLALQSHTSGAWQTGYGPMQGQSFGGQDLLNGRLSLSWSPNDQFKATLTINGWQDKGYNQVGQLFAVGAKSPAATLSPQILDYPLAPHNDRAASWPSCINSNPFDPTAAQELGTTFRTANGTPESQGPGSAVQAGGAPLNCIPLKRDNTYYSTALRMDAEVAPEITLTSLTEFQHFDRLSGQDLSGVPFQEGGFAQSGRISSVFQELRLSGKWADRGNWLVGTNYERDVSLDKSLLTVTASSEVPANLPFAALCLAGLPCAASETPGSPTYNPAAYPLFLTLPLGPVDLSTTQHDDTYAVYASGEYPIVKDVTLLGGIRYTAENIRAEQCTFDGGDGTFSDLTQGFSNLAEVLTGAITADQYLNGLGHGVNAGPGGCATTGPGPNFLSSGANPYSGKLDQSNISWKAGLNWKPVEQTLLYVNISQGYKSGSFPSVTATTYVQLHPVTQEGLLAYETGFKSTLFDRQLTINGAGFYYRYANKQLYGNVVAPVFGPVGTLVNIPHSHVVGFEMSAAWTPNALSGLSVRPSVSYQKSRIDGCSASDGSSCIDGHFNTYNQFGNLIDVNGQPFNNAPEWQASLDAEYDWAVQQNAQAFVGLLATYTGNTREDFSQANFAEDDVFRIPNYTLLDVRAGIKKGAWLVEFYGRNVTNKWYWTAANYPNDTGIRFTGMPQTYGASLSYRFH